MTYDPTTPLGQVRFLCTDRDPNNQVFSDLEIQTLLNLNDSIIRLAAAQALDIIASTEILLQKKMRTLDIESDGPTEARELRAMAAELRRQEYEGAGDFSGLIDYAEQVYTAQNMTERIIREWMRST